MYISQLIRYARCCLHYDDFRYRHKCLVDRLLSQGYKALRLEKSFKKFYGRYQDLIEKYRRSVNAMVSDSFPGQFLFKGQLQRFHKLISNDRIWPSEHSFEVIFEKSLFVFEISASKVRNKRGIHYRFHSFSENNNREILVCDVTSDQSSMISTERSDLRDCKASGNCYV